MSTLKKKILYIVTQAEWGGAQRYVFDLSANLSQNFDITVGAGVSSESQELIQKIQNTKPEIQTIQFKHLRREISPYHDLLAVLEIAKFLRQHKFDIIHLNSSKAGVLGVLAAQLNKNLKSKIIYTAHGWVYLEPIPFYKRWLYLVMEKLAARLRDATIVLSEKEKNLALKYRTAKKVPLFVIPNGIDLNSLKFFPKERAKKELGIALNKFVIGTIANLYKAKGLEHFIKTIKILVPLPISNLQFVIVGNGPEKENLIIEAKKYKLRDRQVFLGSIPEAYQYLKAFDIFVLSSTKEGFPYTILEAMAAGLPIVATEVGAIPEILDNQKSGLIVPPASANALADALKILINNQQKSQELGKNAAETVKQFDLEKMIKKTRIIYQKLL